MFEGFMVTDKGVFDAVWCPEQWRDAANAHNRVKPDRDYDPLESIHQALYLGEKTRWVNITEVPPLGREAIPYKESFWLHIPFREGKFLLTAHSFILDPITSGESLLTVTREKRYDPRDEESYRAEIHLQVLMYNHIKPFFPRIKEVNIISQYPTWPEQSLIQASPDQTLKAEEFACYINDQREGRVELVPRREKCHLCWWKDCPSRFTNITFATIAPLPRESSIPEVTGTLDVEN